jgi:uncharacterized protein
MPKKSLLTKIINFVFSKFFRINDSAQKIALGVGLGVFAGLLPGTGPAAALFLAFIFKANRAAALLGGLLTNTWLSIVTFVLAIKVGSVILKMNWQIVQQQAQGLLKNFDWVNFFKLSFFQVLLPVILGYLLIGLVLGLFSYLLTLIILRKNLQHSNRRIIDLNKSK